MKSLVTANLGFAVPINTLKPLLRKPQPDRDGALAHHRRARQERMEDAATAAAGGSGPAASWSTAPAPASAAGPCACRNASRPKLPFELAVTVKLDDEAGAAGPDLRRRRRRQALRLLPYRRQAAPDPLRRARRLHLENPRRSSIAALSARRMEHAQGAPRKGQDSPASSTTSWSPSWPIPITSAPPSAWPSSATRWPSSRNSRSRRRSPAPRSSPRRRWRSKKSLAKLPLDERADQAKELAPLLKLPGGQRRRCCATRPAQLEKQAEQLRKLAQTRPSRSAASPSWPSCSRRRTTKIDLVHGRPADRPARQRGARRRRLSPASSIAWPARSRPACRRTPTTEATSEALNKFLFKERGFHGSRGDYYSPLQQLSERGHRRPRRLADHAVGAVHGAGPPAEVERGRRGAAGAFRGPPRAGKGEAPQIIDVFEGKFMHVAGGGGEGQGDHGPGRHRTAISSR